MKSQKDFRGQDSATDFVRKAAKLEPIKKSGKEKHAIFNKKDDDFDDEELDLKPKRESVLDYYDDED